MFIYVRVHLQIKVNSGTINHMKIAENYYWILI